MSAVATEVRKERKRFDTRPTPEAPRGRSPISGAPVPAGRPKGTPNRVTQTIKDAIEAACKPGACHPEGLAGWLIERATGGVEDRKIFAGMVAKVIPAQLQASVQGGITVQLPWLTGRNITPHGTATAQADAIDAQVIDVTVENSGALRVGDPRPALEAPASPAGGDSEDPHPPSIGRQGGSE